MIEQILNGIESKEAYKEVYKNSDAKGKHEFLFFLKPEVLGITEGTKVNEVLQLTLNKMADFDMEIASCKIIRSEYLKEYKIMNAHYGAIGEVSSDANAMSDKAKKKFQQVFGNPLSEVKAYGGQQFLDTYKEFDNYTLDVLWQNNNAAEKLAGGTYCQRLKLDDEKVFLLNGFFPRYVNHFTGEGRFLVVFVLRSNISWRKARQSFIGGTDPVSAKEGSLRSDFRKNAAALGLGEIAKSSNGAHLSAGPVEGLVELIRFNSDLSKNIHLNASHFQFGKSMLEKMEDAKVATWLQNARIKLDENKYEPSFDLTEEKDADAVLKMIDLSLEQED